MTEQQQTSSTTRRPEPPPPRPFSDVLREAGKGSAHKTASEQLRNVVERVLETGKTGSVTVTVKVTKAKNADHLTVVATSTSKVPAYDPQTSIYFADGNGDLTRHDPNQLALLGE